MRFFRMCESSNRTHYFVRKNRSFIQSVAIHVIYLKERGSVIIEEVED
ncbi:MAG: hypothetical protein K2X98_03555 [Alphaproteobacteria bacterium]|nr:hypothetical protein [Alphaproteobacteria bacterium]